MRSPLEIDLCGNFGADFRYRTPFSTVGDAEVYIQMVMLSNEIAGRWFFDRGVTSTGLRAGRTRWCCFCNGPFQDGTLGGYLSQRRHA